MTTLYIRDVPSEVADALRVKAEREGRSLSAYVAAELTKIAHRPSNADVVARLRSVDRSLGPTTGDVLAVVAAGRR